MLLQCKFMGIAPIERSRIMADKDTLMEEFVATEAAKNEDAAKDLERVEQQVVAEATMSTEYDDALGNEQAAAEDAETPFEFEQAEIAAEQRSNICMRAVRFADSRRSLTRPGFMMTPPSLGSSLTGARGMA